MYSTNIVQVSLQDLGPKAGATDGTRFESLLILYADEKIYSGIYECTPGAFPVTKDGSCEYMTFLARDATIQGENTNRPI